MKLLEWWGIKGVLHNNCVDFVLQWNGLTLGRKGNRLWKSCLCCVIWSLWYERNKVKFGSIIPDLESFAHSLKIIIGVWAKELLGTWDSSLFLRMILFIISRLPCRACIILV